MLHSHDFQIQPLQSSDQSGPLCFAGALFKLPHHPSPGKQKTVSKRLERNWHGRLRLAPTLRSGQALGRHGKLRRTRDDIGASGGCSWVRFALVCFVGLLRGLLAMTLGVLRVLSVI